MSSPKKLFNQLAGEMVYNDTAVDEKIRDVEVGTGFMDRQLSAVEDNVIVFDDAGNSRDGGMSIDEITSAENISFNPETEEWLKSQTVQAAIDEICRLAKIVESSTTNITLDLTTDDLVASFEDKGAGNQSLKRIIDRKLQDSTVFVNNDTFYGLIINIMPGESTQSVLRLHGLDMPTAFVNINIQNDVVLAGINIQNNTVAHLRLSNHAKVIDGNVIIARNFALRGDNSAVLGGGITTVCGIGYFANSPAVVAPQAPYERQEQLVTGGITIEGNISNGTIVCELGGRTQLGIVDEHGRVNSGVAPAVGVTSPGVINIVGNKTVRGTGSSWAPIYTILRANYDELSVGGNYYKPNGDASGAIVTQNIYQQYNDSANTCYVVVQGGWLPGTEPTFNQALNQYNKVGTNAYVSIGNNLPSSTFTYAWTQVVEADPSTAARNTVKFVNDVAAGRSEIIGDPASGYGITATNAATTSNAANYLGTFKRINSYDPSTKTVTLSANYSLPRPQSTVYVFPYAGSNKLYYGNSVKIELMLQYALANNYETGIVILDGSNLTNSRKVIALDTVNKIVTLNEGLSANCLYTGTAMVCTAVAPKSYGDVTFSAAYTGNKELKGSADLASDLVLDQKLSGVRVTGTGIQNTSAGVASSNFHSASALTVVLDTEPTPASGTGVIVPNPTVLHSYILRRVPQRAVVTCSYNVCAGNAYIIVGTWCAGRNGALGVNSITCSHNFSSTAYIETVNYFGKSPNPSSGLMSASVVSNNNIARAACYQNLRNCAGVGGWFGDVQYGGNTCTDGYLILSLNLRIARRIQMFYNNAQYRLRLQEGTITGGTISEDTVPLIQHSVNIYNNSSPTIAVKSVKVKSEPLGLSLVNYGIRFAQNNCTTVGFTSKEVYIDTTDALAPTVINPVVGVLLDAQHNFFLGLDGLGSALTGSASSGGQFTPFRITVNPGAGANRFALKAVNSEGLRIAALPLNDSRMLIYGVVSGVVWASIVASEFLDGLYRTNPQVGAITSTVLGVGQNVNLVHNHQILI